MHVLKLEHTSP